MDFIYKNKKCFRCQVKNDFPEFFVLNEEHKNNKTEYLVKHLICENTFKTTRNKFLLNGINCPYCNSKRRKSHYTLETAKKEVLEKTHGEYKIISDEFKSSDDKINILHCSCGNIMNISLSHFLRDGRRCKECSKNLLKRMPDSINDQILKLSNNEIIIKSNYLNWNTPMEFFHKKCENTFSRLPKDMIKNCRDNNGVFCPFCSIKSKGEQILINILQKYNINFSHNISINGCKFKRPLKFDFIINNLDNSIKSIIEFDGIQHFDKNRTFGSKKLDFNDAQYRDLIKNDFCEQNNIQLIRINYQNIDNIEEILRFNKIIN